MESANLTQYLQQVIFLFLVQVRSPKRVYRSAPARLARDYSLHVHMQCGSHGSLKMQRRASNQGIDQPLTMSTEFRWAETAPLRAPLFSSTDDEFGILGGVGDSYEYEAPDVLQSYEKNPPASIPLSRYEHNFASDMDGLASPLADDQIQEDDCFEGIGDWPRRLLHVPSMMSLEWKPGNRYGAHVAPRYNAISYTWGRYDLDIPGAKKMKKYRNTKAIQIKGVNWPIPRICPEHFSVDQFQRLIWQACESVDDTEVQSDFLWLDVACIDQNNGPQKYAEIGRQAIIFRGAQRVFVWLTKLRGESLSQNVTSLLESACRYTYIPIRRVYQATATDISKKF